MKVRRRPIILEAAQWVPGRSVPGVCAKYCNIIGGNYGLPHVHTKTGLSIRVASGDWIVRDLDGSFFPCSPQMFSKTYEILGENDDAV
ncbi:MAG TPA: hypothetical protein VMZ26_13375 [Pyrinomonadaceae bacterium]|nr:hypothetical protein [Pyrinomonadaceae bacterium]